MRNRRSLERHLDQVLLRGLDALLDRRGHFLRLANAEAHDAMTVADDNQRTEAQVLAALDDLRHAIDRDDGVLDLELRRIDLLTSPIHQRHRLKLQTGFASRVSHCFYSAVIEKPIAIENDVLDALLDQPLGDGLADRLGARDVAAGRLLRKRAFHGRLHGRCRGDGRARRIVHDLYVHVRHAAEDRQARPLDGAAHAAPDAVFDALTAIVLRLDAHYFAPVFPTFFFSCSPVYRTPFCL